LPLTLNITGSAGNGNTPCNTIHVNHPQLCGEQE
jgi:hypothetical protein